MLENIAGTVSGRTLKLYADSWARYTKFCNEGSLEAGDPGSVLKWRTSLVEAQYSPNTINSHLSAVKSIFAASVPSGEVSIETYTRIKAIGSVSMRALRDRLRPGKDMLTDNDILEIIGIVSISPYPANLRNRAMLWVLATTGMRIDELVSMRVSSIDFEKQVMSVMGKTDTYPRIVPLSDKAKEAMAMWLLARDTQSDWLFNSFSGRSLGVQDKPISTQGAYNMIVEAAKRVGIDISPHDFRRYVATKLAATNIVEAKEILGHSSIMTTQRYVQKANLPDVNWFG